MARIKKSEQAKEIMDKFIGAYQGQKALEVFKGVMPVDEYWEKWCSYESAMKIAARSIRDGKLEKLACRIYPEFKDTLTTFMTFI